MFRRRSFKQNISFQDRLAAWAKEICEQAAKLSLGPERDALLKKRRQADTAFHLDDWANSPGLDHATAPLAAFVAYVFVLIILFTALCS